MTRHRAPSGFTLLEVVLALALAGGLLAGLFAFYRQVLDVRKTLLGEIETLSAQRILMDRLSIELRGAMPTAHFGLVLEGSATHVQFHYADLPGPGVWADSESAAFTPQSDIKRVTYQLRYQDEDDAPVDGDRAIVDADADDIASDADAVILGLERLSQDVVPLPLETDEVEPGARSLFDQFRFVSLRYWTGDAWIDQWSGGDLPTAIEVSLGVKPLPPDVEPAAYPYETFTRVIALTGAQHRVEGEPINGATDDDFGALDMSLGEGGTLP